MSESTSTAEIGTTGAENLSHEGEGSSGGSGLDFSSVMNEVAEVKVDPGEVAFEDNEKTETDGIPVSEQGDPNKVEGEEGNTEEGEEPIQQNGKRTLQEIQKYRQEQKNNRKYDGLDEEESKLFKQMSQAAYDRLYPAYLASKESATKLKALEDTNKQLENRRWYEEDGAWTLSPEYQEAKQNVDLLDFEENYWTEQLTKVERGEEYNPLDGKPGDYKEGPLKPATVEAKVNIMRKLQAIGGYKQQLATKIDSITKNFASKHKSFGEGLKGVNDHLFGKLDITLPHIAPQYKSWLEKFPTEFQGQLPYQMLAKSAVVIEGLAKALREKEALGGLKKSARVTASSSGPGNGKAVGGTSATNGNSAANWDKEFQSLTNKRFH